MRALAQRVSQSTVSWGLAATILRFGSALILLPLVLRRISPEELGLWYIFVSLGALAALMDLGFAPVVVRSAGYLWAGSPSLLRFGIDRADRETEIRPPNLALLSELVASLRVYYLCTGVVLFLLLGMAGGVWIWHKSVGLTNAVSILLAFFAYALGVSFAFANSLWPALLSGINAVRLAQQITVACLLAYFVLAVAGLWLGYGIWALVLATIVAGLAERIIGRAVFGNLISLPPGKFNPSIIRVLWPNAWRTAAVGLGAFMILQANTLICSAFLDLRTTASYGLSLQAGTLLIGMSSIWVTLKMPMINQLRAQGLLDRIAQIFRQRIILSLLTFVFGGIVLLSLGKPLLELFHTRTQLLPTALLATLFLIQLLEMHHSLYGELVYSENVNPFVKPALISGIVVIILSLLLTPRFGVWGMLLSTGVVQLCFNNWWPVLRGIRGLGPAGRNFWRLS